MPDKKTEVSQNGRKAAKLANRLERRKNRNGVSEPADYAGADAELLKAAIAAVTASKCGITFSYTQDGGAYAITLLSENEIEREYVRPTEDFSVYLKGLIEDFGL